jgi:stearoyl-CoA desaturase (delta-9 desaturase)
MHSAPILPAPSDPARKPSSHEAHWLATAPFYLVHVVAVAGVALLGWSWKGLALAVGLYYARMFFVTAGYHRYFAHRTYKTSRVFQFLLAFFAQTSTQKGALWWAAHHRIHHKLSDKPGDVHSMKLEGFWWSHVGWILSTKHEQTEWEQIPDLAKYPELRWLNRFQIVPSLVYCVALFLAGGSFALVWGYFVSTVLLWHGTFTINSLMHWMGRRRYATTDESRNSLTLALVTLGEGWHNNHHYYPRSTAQGFFWWEIDITFYVLRALSLVGLVWDLHTPPKKIRDRTGISRRRAPAVAAPSVADALAADPAPAE